MLTVLVLVMILFGEPQETACLVPSGGRREYAHRRRELYAQTYYVQIYLQIDVVKLKFLTQTLNRHHAQASEFTRPLLPVE